MDREIVLEANWILWPHDPGLGDLSRLLSLTTGVDWRLPDSLFRVRREGGGFVLLQRAELDARGLFAARRDVLPGRRLIPFGRPSGAVSPSAIALTESGESAVRAATPEDLRDKNAVILATAPDGDAVVRARDTSLGRVILVEYPPRPGESWTRFWELGRGWREGQSPVFRGVGGLIPAREVPRLLTRPESFAWTPSDRLLRREADRWLPVARVPWATWLVVLGALGAGLAFLVEVARDRRTARADTLGLFALGLPAAILLSVISGASIGPAFVPLNVGAAALALGLATVTVARVFWRARPGARLTVLATLGLLAATFASPVAPWSGALRDLPGGLSPETFGATALYAAVAVGSTRDTEGFLWAIPRGLVALATAYALLVAPEWAFVPLLGGLAGEGWTPPPVGLVALALPAGLARLRGGLDWHAQGLHVARPDGPVVNLWLAFSWVLSVPTLVFAFAAAFAAMTAPRYVGYRVRRASVLRGLGASVLRAAAGLALASVLTPALWPAVLIVAAGGVVILLGEARIEDV